MTLYECFEIFVICCYIHIFLDLHDFAHTTLGIPYAVWSSFLLLVWGFLKEMNRSGWKDSFIHSKYIYILERLNIMRRGKIQNSTSKCVFREEDAQEKEAYINKNNRIHISKIDITELGRLMSFQPLNSSVLWHI